MAGITNMAVVNEALKVYYLPGLQAQLATATPLMALLEKTSQNVVGNEVHMALRYGRRGGSGMRADDDTLPTPNSRGTRQAIFPLKNFFAHMQISDKAVKASRSSAGAFVDLLQAEMDDTFADAKDNVARMLYGAGDGKLATITQAAWAGGVLTLTVSDSTYLFERMLLDVIHAASGAPVANGSQLEVLTVDPDTNVITLDAPTDISAAITAGSDFLVVNGDYGQELTGLGAILTPDTTIYGIDRSQNKWFNPTVVAVNGEVSDTVVKKGEHLVEARAGGEIDVHVVSYGVSRAYADFLIAERRLVNPGTVKLEGGYEVPAYEGKPLIEDRYAPRNTWIGLQRDTLKIFQLEPPAWLDRDGAILSRLPDKAVWAATLAWYLELGCNKVRANMRLSGITEH